MKCFFSILILATACSAPKSIRVIAKRSGTTLTGSAFYKSVAAATWQERDSIAVSNILAGDMPSFLKEFVRINTSIKTSNGKTIKAHYYVMPDYMSIGTNDDWARVPLTPMAAQKIADSFHCFLSTRKIADDVYRQAIVKPEPVPMYAYRDSSPTMWQHHLIIEGQRKDRKGLIAGIKKDVIITGKLTRDSKTNRVAIYGWHKPNGTPIQPVYTGHVNWYVDYSHGVRLVYRTIWVDGKQWDYIDILKDKELQKLLCDEEWCDVYRY
jgi:hypothetical protein